MICQPCIDQTHDKCEDELKKATRMYRSCCCQHKSAKPTDDARSGDSFEG